MNKRAKEHSFSIEMQSEYCVRKMFFLDEEKGHVLFEGFLGELKNIVLVEGVMLEIEGKNGILKLDITQQEIKQSLLAENASEIRAIKDE